MALPSEIPNCSSGLTSLSWLQNISLSVQLEVDGIACSGGSDRDASKGRTSKESKSLAEPKAESKPRKPRTSHDTTGKPPYSFASLIFMAIEASPSKCLPVKDIYTWIITHFPYYRSAAPAWKNSVRHNLSLNKCFGKKGEDSDCRSSKGSLWIVESDSRDALLQQLKKTGAIQAGLYRTVESSRDFWADALKGSGYYGDDESEVIEALIGIDTQDEDRVQLPPRPRSCPPRVDNQTKVPSWMVKLRLSPYMAANVNKKIIRSTRVLYNGLSGGGSSRATNAMSTGSNQRPTQLVPSGMHGADSSSDDTPAFPSANGAFSSHTSAFSSGVSAFPCANNDAFRQPNSPAFSNHSGGSEPDGVCAGCRCHSSHSTTGRSNPIAGASFDEEEGGSVSAESLDALCEEDHTAAKNLMSLMNASISNAQQEDGDDTVSAAAVGKPSKNRRKRKSAPSSSESKAKKPRGVPHVNESSETKTSSRRNAPIRQPHYLEGVENGAVGARRGSRKSVRSSESAFVNVAKSSPKPKLKAKPRKRKSDKAKVSTAAAAIAPPVKETTKASPEKSAVAVEYDAAIQCRDISSPGDDDIETITLHPPPLPAGFPVLHF